jgi:hypothetical protein
MLDDRFTLEVTCYVCPTQLEGRWNNRPWYFRYRHGHATMILGEEGEGKGKTYEWMDKAQSILDARIGPAESDDGMMDISLAVGLVYASLDSW